ncbi:DUF3124 domain-containing protein [Cryomorphaceae bacterium]|nr:DUF3124 domain-containing protein [Cryomorphaceae bacterium]
MLVSCMSPSSPKGNDEKPVINWKERETNVVRLDSLDRGVTYVPVYSGIYSQTEKRLHALTVTASIRNTSVKDTLFLTSANYYDTHGNLVQEHLTKPVYLLPMETVEIVINESDESGGPGSNFLIEWKHEAGSPEPLMETVMISTSGQQGISFTSRGVRIE